MAKLHEGAALPPLQCGSDDAVVLAQPLQAAHCNPSLRQQRSSEGDLALAGLLEGATPGATNWLSAEPSGEGRYLVHHRSAAAGQGQAPGAQALRHARADLSSAWMDDLLGGGRDDAEAWLCAPPAGVGGGTQQQRWGEADMKPLPRLAASASASAAARARRAGSACSSSAVRASPTSRRATLATALPAGPSPGTPARSSSRQPTARLQAAQPAQLAAQLATQHQQAAAPARQSSLHPATDRRPGSPPSRRPSTASPAPAAGAARTLWRPDSCATPLPRARQAMAAAPASSASTGSGTAPSSPTHGSAGRATQAAPAAASQPPSPHRQLLSRPQRDASEAQAALTATAGSGQLSPVSKVAQWLHSPAYPASSAGRHKAAGSPTCSRRASLQASSDSGSSWRIAVAAQPQAQAAAGPAAAAGPVVPGGPGRLPASRLPAPSSAPASAALSRQHSMQPQRDAGHTAPASRIPRPATAAAAAAAPRPASSARASSATVVRSELALKQLAQRALAAGSGGSGGSSPPAPRSARARRPSWLRDAVAAEAAPGGESDSPSAGAARAPGMDAAGGASQPGSPSKTFYSARSASGRSLAASFATASESSAAGSWSTDSSPRRTRHRLSGGSSPLAKASSDSSDALLADAQAAAASSLAAAQAVARTAAEEVALLASASPSAWHAAQAAAASPPAGASPADLDAMLDCQLEQLDRLCQCLSDASSKMAEICVLEALATSRRASSRDSLMGSGPASAPGSAPASPTAAAGRGLQQQLDC